MRLVKTVSAILTFLIVAVAAIPYMAVMSVVSEMDCYVSGCALNNNDGDTYQFTSWTNSGTTTFNGNTIPGSIYGTVNDGHVTFTGVNMGIVKLTSLDTTTPGSTVITVDPGVVVSREVSLTMPMLTPVKVTWPSFTVP